MNYLKTIWEKFGEPKSYVAIPKFGQRPVTDSFTEIPISEFLIKFHHT